MDALLVPVQITFSSIHSPSRILIMFLVLCRIGPLFFVLIYLCGSKQRRRLSRSGLYTQYGYTFMDQSRGKIGSVFKEIGYGSVGRYS